MSLAILGMGTAVPPDPLFAQESKQIAQTLCQCSQEQMTWLAQVFEHSGIEKRHMVWGRPAFDDVLHGTRLSGSICLPTGLPDDRGPTTAQRMGDYERFAPELALQASSKALARSGLTAKDITHLVTVSCTGFRAPGVDCELFDGLGLHPETSRTHVGFMGCHGALNGLRAAHAYAKADPGARILLCAVELCSLHYYYRWDGQKMVANALFADGAAALVTAGEAPAGSWRHAASGSCVFPNSADVMSWTVGDHGFEMVLSRKVPGLIAENLRPWLTSWLKRHKVELSDIRSWALHPGGPKILSAVDEALGLTPEDSATSRAILRDFGNMSSPTILFILNELQKQRAPRPCVALGFGPGLTAEAALFT